MLRNKETSNTLELLSSKSGGAYVSGVYRDVISFKVKSTYEEIKAFFADGVSLEAVQTITEGETKKEMVTDYSDYCIAGDITDHRDGTFTVIMGAKTEDEIANELLKENVNIILPLLDDEQAVTVKKLYPVWEIGKNLEAGERVLHGDNLYKVLQGHYAQEYYAPDIATSLFTRIDETHAGTLEDPIPYDGNMVLENGKYYTQDGEAYVCIRDSENAVYHALSELVGTYVEHA